MESSEAPDQLVSPRISFSHDLVATPPPAPARRSDAWLLLSVSRSSSRLPEPEFDFANANAAAFDDDVAPADRLFAGGVLLPVPPLPPPAPKQQQPSGGGGRRVDAPARSKQRRPAGSSSSWASPFSRSCSVNAAATSSSAAAAATGAPRSAGMFGCPPLPLARSRSAGSAAARDGVFPADAGLRPQQHKKAGGAAAASNGSGGGGCSRGSSYYYGGSRKGSRSSGYGVRVSPVLNVPFIGTSVANVLSYLLCDCSSSKIKKGRGF